MKQLNTKLACPEFPYFGAPYPDARCVEGYLWDLDKCTDDGGLYGGGEEPCPFCNSKEFVRHHTDSLNGTTRKRLFEHVERLKEKYNYKAITTS